MEVISHVTQPVRAVVPGLRHLSARPRWRPRDTWFKPGRACLPVLGQIWAAARARGLGCDAQSPWAKQEGAGSQFSEGEHGWER